MTIYHRWLDLDLGYMPKKGSSGGGGGGGSGTIDYPAHMKAWHTDALSHGGVDSVTSSMTDIMNAALGASPWTGETAYDPDADITAFEAAISGFDAILAGISETTEWAALYTQAVTSIGTASEADIVADIDAFSDQLDDELLTKVLPRFEGGMRDINAVQSSAFVLGRALIEGFRDRDVAKHSSSLRLALAADNAKNYSAATGQMVNFLMSKYAWEESYMRTVVEGKRIKIVAKKEEQDANLKIADDDALWDLEVFQYGANLLASIGSGTMNPKDKSPSGAQSMLGGAMSGAAAGAMVGGPVGAVIGGVLGGAIGML